MLAAASDALSVKLAGSEAAREGAQLAAALAKDAQTAAEVSGAHASLLSDTATDSEAGSLRSFVHA